MKKTILTLATALLLGGSILVFAQGPQGRGPDLYPGGYRMYGCPMKGGGKMGVGMHGAWREHGRMGRSMGMHGAWGGRGMMGRGWMRGGGICSGACPRDSLTYTPSGELTEPLTEARAQEIVAHFVAGNPNLQVGKVTEKDGSFIVEIVTKKGNALVDKIAIDKKTAWMRSVE